MSTREAFHISEEDLIQYALGTLKEGQLSQFTAHISFCTTCRNELGRIQVELASFAAALPSSEPPAGARERFLQRLSDDSAASSKLTQLREKSRAYLWSKAFQRWFETPVPFGILSCTLAAVLLFVIYDDLSHIRQIRQLMPAMKRYEQEAAEFTELRKFLHGTDSQQVTLYDRPQLTKTPQGHAIYSASSGKLVFTAANMPAPPTGKVYELWLLPAAGSAPIPAGLFTPDLQGNAAVVFPDLPANVQAGGFGVTIENEGGATKPTPPIILSGQ